MFDAEVEAQAREVMRLAKARGWQVATAESCTGGLLAGALTALPGASSLLDRGFVTYSNGAKTEMLGVPAALIEAHGAVSEPVARAMAEGALARSKADVTVSITGIAGPDGGSEDKPVGLVHFALARSGGHVTHRREMFGDQGRKTIRDLSVRTALSMLAEGLSR